MQASLEISRAQRYRDWTHLAPLKFPDLKDRSKLPSYRIREYRLATQQAIEDLMFNFFYKHADICQFPEGAALPVEYW